VWGFLWGRVGFVLGGDVCETEGDDLFGDIKVMHRHVGPFHIAAPRVGQSRHLSVGEVLSDLPLHLFVKGESDFDEVGVGDDQGGGEWGSEASVD
jgi:hypothetical protein